VALFGVQRRLALTVGEGMPRVRGVPGE
jgi:hypothetical protein